MTLEDFKYSDIIHRCFRCGYCKFPVSWMDVNNCPAYARYRMETYSCGGRLWLTRAWLSDELDWTEHFAHIIFSCTACKNCEVKCPLSFNVDILNIIIAAKEEMVERGTIPSEVKDFLENIQRYGNPYGTAQTKRGEWLEGTEIEQYQGQDYLYYVGCIGSYDTRAQETAKILGKALQKAGVSFGVLGNEEKCDGNEVNMIGETALFEMQAEENIAQFKDLGVQRIVTLSPHSYNAIKNEYPKYNGSFEVLHQTQFLQNLINDGRLNVTNGFEAKVTIHDPCFLGRWNGEYEAFREILKAIPGIDLIEMERNRDSALCCGGGGANFYIDFLGGSADSPSRRRVREAVETGANILAVACPNCLTMLEDAVKAEGLDDKLSVKDISEIVGKAAE
ncbi:MAG: (Fe-S)-binding protein [Deltaproteobacteria bacterium]|nr:(Fe-S)-binding protein [Deltaproteobacteria bacterium]